MEVRFRVLLTFVAEQILSEPDNHSSKCSVTRGSTLRKPSRLCKTDYPANLSLFPPTAEYAQYGLRVSLSA